MHVETQKKEKLQKKKRGKNANIVVFVNLQTSNTSVSDIGTNYFLCLIHEIIIFVHCTYYANKYKERPRHKYNNNSKITKSIDSKCFGVNVERVLA